jgi:outer membrane receptor protein involved in Fe transport
MKRLKLFYLLIVAALTINNLFAQAGTSKLAGKVIDADTKEPLIGANILILGTNLGAATDVEGKYYILNVTPGTYDVRISFVGYAPKTIQNVRLVAGITYELNVELSTDFSLPEITVKDQKFFEEKSTNTVKVIDADQINRLPVAGVERLVSLQAGVVISDASGGAGGNAVINVRGGRGNEVIYIVDGVVQNDPLSGANFSQVSNAAIEQISFQVGGFEAKYGQAQSGVVNVTTKSGTPFYNAYGEVITSEFTDNFGYNLYTLNIGGPIIPGVQGQTFFLSSERGWFKDNNPRWYQPEFKSIGKKYKYLPNNWEGQWKFTARTYHELGSQFNLRLGANYNSRDRQLYQHSFAKNNPEHNPRSKQYNLSTTARLSQNIGTSSFWNLTLGYKIFDRETGDGVYFNRLEEYGDTLYNPYLLRQGDQSNLNQDEVGIFVKKGRVFNRYTLTNNQTFSGDLNFTSQLENHLIEIGGGAQYNLIRYYNIAPLAIARFNRDYVRGNDTIRARPRERRYSDRRPYLYGYNDLGKKTNIGDTLEPKQPVFVYGYLQDRYELSDLVLNVGVRLDYFDSKAEILKDKSLPYAYGNPNDFDDEDFKKKKPEIYISPRIGIGFPVTDKTVFHAQYGKFIQPPLLEDLYPGINRLKLLIQTDNLDIYDGHLGSEQTTQYEIGFRQVLGDNIGALSVTAFYKNTKGLTNLSLQFFRREPNGELLRYFAPTNSDFGTIKGLAVSLSVARISYFSFNIDYTYSIAEGTGSSSDASYTAAFRNNNPVGEVPKVIAPLDFDQRHTGILSVDFFAPKNELGLLELTNVNILIRFASGRPYTPLKSQNLLEGSTNWGETGGYINSKYGPGTFRIDLKAQKTFALSNLEVTPYIWIENLLNTKNVVSVWRSTGSAETTAFLETDLGRSLARQNGQNWVYDYMALERNPFNYGIPRLIKLGVKANFNLR